MWSLNAHMRRPCACKIMQCIPQCTCKAGATGFNTFIPPHICSVQHRTAHTLRFCAKAVKLLDTNSAIGNAHMQACKARIVAASSLYNVCKEDLCNERQGLQGLLSGFAYLLVKRYELQLWYLSLCDPELQPCKNSLAIV